MRRISANAALIFLGDAAARALGFFTTIHLASSMGKEGYGLVTVGFAVLSYALWFADLGITTLGAREMARPESERRFSPGEIFATRAILGALVFAVALPLVFLIYGGPARYYAIFLLAIFPYAFSLEWYYQGTQRFVPFTISRFLASALYFATVFIYVDGGSGWPAVPIGYILATLIAAAVLLLCMRGRFSFKGFSFSRFIATIRSASVIGVGGILAQSVQLLPPLVLGASAARGAMEDTGVLGAALKVIFVVLIVDRVFATVFLPAITRLWSADRAAAEQSLERLLRLVIVLGFGIGTLLTVHAAGVMAFIYTRDYAGGGATLVILSWFGVATLVNSIFSFGLIGSGHEREYFRATIAGGIATVILTFACIHFQGLTGAAVAIVASEITLTTLTCLAFRRHVSIRFARPLAVSALAAAGIILAAGYLQIDRLVFAPAVGITFLAIALILGAFGREDILWLMKR